MVGGVTNIYVRDKKGPKTGDNIVGGKDLFVMKGLMRDNTTDSW